MYVQYVKEKSTSERTPVSQPIGLVLYLCLLRAPLRNPLYNTHNHKGKLILLKGVGCKNVQPFDHLCEGVKVVG